ncbi:MAG TPA: hypothetical protein VMU84_01925, partial [Thermoanaerobaculia bacterium]|nr:hypothetical protein [Thermoanaerobaculia bacterium]
MADHRGARNRFAFPFARKHYTALIALAVYNIILFAPVMFTGVVISPNDLIQRYDPWASMRKSAVVARNPLLLDPPASYYTLMALVQEEPQAFHWNPWIASGEPGFGSSSSAVLSPFILIPSVTLPLAWVYTAIIFLKLNVAFLFAYLWLREERLGRYGAAIGAIIIAGSGIFAVRWLWQMTNATALYPALLWIVRRTFDGKRTPVWVMTLIVLAYALAGFPSSMAYGVYLAAAYALFLAFRARARARSRARLFPAAIAVILGAIIAAPSLVPLVQWIPRSGYLYIRRNLSTLSFPAQHFLSFVLPERLGNPARGNWIGDAAFGVANNFVEATIYVGLVAIPLTLAAFFYRRKSWFWFATAAFVLACMFGLPGLGPIVGKLPGFKYSMLTRTASLLPLPIGYLSAAGAAAIFAKLRRDRLVKRSIITIVALLAAFDLALFAERFQPYLARRDAEIPTTPMIDFLQRDTPPFRVAPFFNYMWPNTSQMFHIEDVRSHFMSEDAYRKLMQRIDPGAWTGKGTVLGFNSLEFRFDDPIVGMLNIRWFIEHRAIDIVKWKTFAATEPIAGAVPFEFTSHTRVQRDVKIDADPFWAIDLPIEVAEANGGVPRLLVTLANGGKVKWSRAFTLDDVRALGHVYVPVHPYARVGDTVTLTIRSHRIRGTIHEFGRVKTPVVFERELPDGRLFRNLAEVPRFHPVSRVRTMSDAEFLATRDLDLANEAVLTDGHALPQVGESDARVTLTSYEPAEQHLDTHANAPFLLASSEKLTPELRVRIDGRRVPIVEINTMFAGIVVPAGEHHVRFRRRIARGWWWFAAAGVVLWLGSLGVRWRRSHRFLIRITKR